MLEVVDGVFSSRDFKLEIALEVAAGEFCAVLGPSGAGKSTLLNLIAGFESLATGKIIIDGRDVTREVPANRQVSMVFQDNNVFPHLNLRNNVALGIRSNLKLSQNDWAETDEALARVGLEHLSNRKPVEVSGGERQRVALARMLVRQSRVLLLDEPFAALDPGLRVDMLSLVSELVHERKLACLLVSHQPEEIRRAAQKIVFVDGQTVLPARPSAEFFKDVHDPDVKRYLGI